MPLHGCRHWQYEPFSHDEFRVRQFVKRRSNSTHKSFPQSAQLVTSRHSVGARQGPQQPESLMLGSWPSGHAGAESSQVRAFASQLRFRTHWPPKQSTSSARIPGIEQAVASHTRRQRGGIPGRGTVTATRVATFSRMPDRSTGTSLRTPYDQKREDEPKRASSNRESSSQPFPRSHTDPSVVASLATLKEAPRHRANGEFYQSITGSYKKKRRRVEGHSSRSSPRGKSRQEAGSPSH